MTTLETCNSLRLSTVVNRVASNSYTPSESHSLGRAVQSAVRVVDETFLRPIAARDAGLAFQPKTLLALLTYCYASQVYGSAEIEDAMRRDTYFRQLCSNEFPGTSAIRRFRRQNREAIQLCLTTVLCLLAEKKVEEGFVTKFNKAHIADEAVRRVTMSMFIDSTVLDGD